MIYSMAYESSPYHIMPCSDVYWFYRQGMVGDFVFTVPCPSAHQACFPCMMRHLRACVGQDRVPCCPGRVVPAAADAAADAGGGDDEDGEITILALSLSLCFSLSFSLSFVLSFVLSFSLSLSTISPLSLSLLPSLSLSLIYSGGVQQLTMFTPFLLAY